MEATLTQPRTYLQIQLNSGEITQNKQLNESKRKASKTYTHQRTSSNTNCPHLLNKRWGTDWPSDSQLVGKTHQRKSQQEPKTKDIHRANINYSPRSVRSGDQGDCTLNLTGILSQKFTPKIQGVRTEQLKKQRLTGRVSQTLGRHKNNPQMKERGKSQKQC